jgi:hypothetical protein
MMKQRSISLIAATLVVIGGGTGAAWAAHGASHATGAHHQGATASRPAAAAEPRTVTLRFHANEVRPNATLDLGPKGPSAGDQIIENETLIRNGHVLGHNANHCMLINPTHTPRFLVECTVTWVLHRGQVTGVGAISFQPPIEVAITGGTGAFEGASGTATVIGTDNPRNDVDVLELTLPPR